MRRCLDRQAHVASAAEGSFLGHSRRRWRSTLRYQLRWACQVVRLGRKGELVGTSDFGEIIKASPAVVDDAMFVRSDRHLWKIAGPSNASETNQELNESIGRDRN